MFIIAEGKVRISKMVPGIGEEALAILEKGQYFGEMSLIEDGPRSADAIAHSRTCKLYELSRDKLDQVMFTDKELAFGFVVDVRSHPLERVCARPTTRFAHFSLSRRSAPSSGGARFS